MLDRFAASSHKVMRQIVAAKHCLPSLAKYRNVDEICAMLDAALPDSTYMLPQACVK